MITLSPGLIQGSLELLLIADTSRLEFASIRHSFSHFGSLSSTRITEIVQMLQWLYADENGIATLTPAGTKILELRSYESQLRQALLDYIDVTRPVWVQDARYGRSRVLSFAGSEIVQIFVEAGVAQGTDKEIVQFWDLIASRARGQESNRLLAIGRDGERRTVEYEEIRTGKRPKWIALEDNSDGYDVLSVVDVQDGRSLSIEVKTTMVGERGSFYLTQNEWLRSQEAETHLFYLWNLELPTHPSLARVSVDEMQNHIPQDQGDGNWKMLEIPFHTFQSSFSSI